HQVAEETVLQALRLGHEEIRRLCQWQQEIKQAAGKPLMSYPSAAVHPDIVAAVHDFVAERIGGAARNSDKAARERAIDELKGETVAALEERFPVFKGVRIRAQGRGPARDSRRRHTPGRPPGRRDQDNHVAGGIAPAYARVRSV